MQQYGGYSTDITRTWPNSRRFSAAQRDLYEMVLGVQRTCVSLCREDGNNMSLDAIHRVAERALREGLVALGFDLSAGVSSAPLSPSQTS
jgi:intermediate cleaving peptidase 55